MPLTPDRDNDQPPGTLKILTIINIANDINLNININLNAGTCGARLLGALPPGASPGSSLSGALHGVRPTLFMAYV